MPFSMDMNVIEDSIVVVPLSFKISIVKITFY